MNDDLSESIKNLLSTISEAANGPTRLGAPHAGETLSDLHARLLVTRAAMTTVAGRVGTLTLLTGTIRKRLIEARGVLEDEEASVVGNRKPVFTEDYSSAKERNARLAAGTLQSRRAVRTLEKTAADIEAALIYGRDRHRELDRAVRDIETRLRLITFEGGLT